MMPAILVAALLAAHPGGYPAPTGGGISASSSGLDLAADGALNGYKLTCDADDGMSLQCATNAELSVCDGACPAWASSPMLGVEGNLEVHGDQSLGNASADTLTVNSGIVVLENIASDVTSTSAAHKFMADTAGTNRELCYAFGTNDVACCAARKFDGTDSMITGEMQFYNQTDTLTLTNQTTFYQIVTFATGNMGGTNVTFDSSNKELDVCATCGGLYFVSANISAALNAGDNIWAMIYTFDNASTTTAQTQCTTKRGMTANATGTIPITCTVNITGGHAVRLYIEDVTSAGKVLTLNHGNLSIFKL